LSKDWFDVKEGEASIFKPEDGQYRLVARVQMEDWPKLAAGAPDSCAGSRAASAQRHRRPGGSIFRPRPQPPANDDRRLPRPPRPRRERQRPRDRNTARAAIADCAWHPLRQNRLIDTRSCGALPRGFRAMRVALAQRSRMLGRSPVNEAVTETRAASVARSPIPLQC